MSKNVDLGGNVVEAVNCINCINFSIADIQRAMKDSSHVMDTGGTFCKPPGSKTMHQRSGFRPWETLCGLVVPEEKTP